MKKILLTITLLFASQSFSEGVTYMVCSYPGGSQGNWVADSSIESYKSDCQANLGGTATEGEEPKFGL